MDEASKPSRPNSGEHVNLGVDNALLLVPLYALDHRNPRHKLAVRALKNGTHDPVNEALEDWKRSSREEFDRVIEKLNQMLEDPDFKPSGRARSLGNGLVEIKGKQSRLFCFKDGQGTATVVCVDTFWIGKGPKGKMQDRAIERAKELMQAWQKAEPIPGMPSDRIRRVKVRR